jgi:hypothetical protein
VSVPLSNVELQTLYLDIIAGRELNRDLLERAVDDLQEARQIRKYVDDIHLGDSLARHWRNT